MAHASCPALNTPYACLEKEMQYQRMSDRTTRTDTLPIVVQYIAIAGALLFVSHATCRPD